jgi:hypothetical protein
LYLPGYHFPLRSTNKINIAAPQIGHTKENNLSYDICGQRAWSWQNLQKNDHSSMVITVWERRKFTNGWKRFIGVWNGIDDGNHPDYG